MREEHGYHADSENLVTAGKSPGDEVTGTPWHLFRLCHDLGRRLGSQRPRYDARMSRQAHRAAPCCNEVVLVCAAQGVPAGASAVSIATLNSSGFSMTTVSPAGSPVVVSSNLTVTVITGCPGDNRRLRAMDG